MADNITCPRCKTQQPESARSGGSARTDRCASCGLDFKAYAEHVILSAIGIISCLTGFLCKPGYLIYASVT